MALAQSVDAATPGAAGLAYQAANLAIKAVLLAADGADVWLRGDRHRRVSELLGSAAADVDFLHRVRQLDFYADAARGEDVTLPSPEDCRGAVVIAGEVLRAADGWFSSRDDVESADGSEGSSLSGAC
jgi:hypothetical protein